MQENGLFNLPQDVLLHSILPHLLFIDILNTSSLCTQSIFSFDIWPIAFEKRFPGAKTTLIQKLPHLITFRSPSTLFQDFLIITKTLTKFFKIDFNKKPSVEPEPGRNINELLVSPFQQTLSMSIQHHHLHSYTWEAVFLLKSGKYEFCLNATNLASYGDDSIFYESPRRVAYQSTSLQQLKSELIRFDEFLVPELRKFSGSVSQRLARLCLVDKIDLYNFVCFLLDCEEGVNLSAFMFKDIFVIRKPIQIQFKMVGTIKTKENTEFVERCPSEWAVEMLRKYSGESETKFDFCLYFSATGEKVESFNFLRDGDRLQLRNQRRFVQWDQRLKNTKTCCEKKMN